MSERTLTPAGEKEREMFEETYGSDGNCSCHNSPPCGSCLHPGNPLNQAERDDCWMDEKVAEINKMTHLEMARLYRFAEPGHEYFDLSKHYHIHFYNRFKELGGMTSAVSKAVGWDKLL